MTGRPGRNLDGWMLSRDYNRACFHRESQGVDVAVVEGVMGLYDGYGGRSEAGSTAEMAKWLGLPVVLIVDVKSMARSVAAVVKGFETFDPEVPFAGVVFNGVGSDRHRLYLEQALEGHVRMPCLGAIRRRPELAIPERHLGLHTAQDHPLPAETTEGLADLAETDLDLDRLLAGLEERRAAGDGQRASNDASGRRIRLGVAMDRAFCFYYQDNLDLLTAAGADIIAFSPLDDERLPDDLDGLYFGGGYPELHAAKLSGNRSLLAAVAEAAGDGMPIYAECGGFMYLGRTLSDLEGGRHAMTGCFPLDFTMRPALQSLGYREITLGADTIIGPAGQRLRGHEFHYSTMIQGSELPDNAYRATARDGVHKQAPGFVQSRCLGSYIHLHFGSNPCAAQALVAACRDYHAQRSTIHAT